MGDGIDSIDMLSAFHKGENKQKKQMRASFDQDTNFGGREVAKKPSISTYKHMIATGELSSETSTKKGAGGAGHEAVSVRRNRSSIQAGNILLERVAIPADYFQGHIERNPFTGRVVMTNLLPQYNFTHVDLFDRDYVLARPDEMGRDSYLYQAEALGYRTWVLQSWHNIQQEGLRGGDVSTTGHGDLDILEMTKADMQTKALGFSLIDENGSAFGRYSPFTVGSAVMLLICLTIDIPLMFAAMVLFLMTFLVTTKTNTPTLFRFHRVISAPVRWPITLVVAARLSQISVYAAEGKWVSIAALILAFLLLLADFVFGDVANASAFTAEHKFKILRTLPGNVFICKKAGGTEDSMTDIPMGDNVETGVDESIAGLTHLGFHPRDLKGTVILADVQGLICRLHACSPMHWREHLRYARQQLPVFSTRTFNNVRPTGEFFLEDGKPRNLFEILGLNSDGSANQSQDKQSGHFGRQSLLGRRATYMVVAHPEGIPQMLDQGNDSVQGSKRSSGRMPRATDAVMDDDDDDFRPGTAPKAPTRPAKRASIGM